MTFLKNLMRLMDDYLAYLLIILLAVTFFALN